MASIAYEYACNKEHALLPDPNQHTMVGWVLALQGFSLTAPIKFKNDITCWVPYNSPQLQYAGATSLGGLSGQTDKVMGKMKVVGVIEQFTWPGGVGDAISVDFWVSQQNAAQLKTAQQATLTSTRVQSFAWWIIDHDPEAKKWYEKSFPISTPTITGHVVPKDNPDLDVNLIGESFKDGIEAYGYKIHMQLGPAADAMHQLQFANSSTLSAVKNFGLIIGDLSAGAMS